MSSQPLLDSSQAESQTSLFNEEATLPRQDASAVFENAPPSQFIRINRQRHILYDPDFERDFSAWWADTIHGRLNVERKKNKIKWMGAKISPHWKNFDQVANISTGEAGIRCRLCHKLLNHPHSANTGTTNMSIHTSSAGCRRNRRDGVQIDLTTMLALVRNNLSLCKVTFQGNTYNLNRPPRQLLSLTAHTYLLSP